MSFQKMLLWVASGAVVVFAVGFPGLEPGARGKDVVSQPLLQKDTGEAIFRKQCAPCHGEKGEGTSAYSRALTGDRTIPQLAQYIAKNMPPGPKKCSAPDSQKVAAFMYDAFYSPIAQERIRPARVSLARLTVRQMRNATTDLVNSFRTQPTPGAERGLRAEYFRARRLSKEDRVLERVDPIVKFDFGKEGPSGATFNPQQFSIRWSGSVVASDTGVHEFVVHTDQAVRLWVNDNRKPILDAWVKSGKDTEFHAPIYLIGGRTYSLRMEFSKSTQGVDDTEKNKGKPAAPAFITLAWKRPRQAEEPIPTRSLLPVNVPEVYVMDTPFPPDDRSMGYERGNAVSKGWDEATTASALETADYIIEHLQELAGAADDATRLKAFCRTFVERALRRPIDPDTEKRYITRQFDISPDLQTAVKRVVLLTLMSPRFLYHAPASASPDPYAIASRLSFTLWDSLPDEPLLKAAAAGQLATREGIRQQAERMVADPRAWSKQRDFLLQWLKVDGYPDLAKDTKTFPGFTPEIASDLRTSLDLTLESVVCSEKSDFRELLLTNQFYLNGRLSALYGGNLPADAPFQPVAMDAKTRAGILTHPYLLASFAYVATSSPIHRGVLIARNVMGRTLQPPPQAFVPLAANLHPNMTTRERVSLQTKPAACIGCHGMINPLGFTLESFDAIGRLRTEENGKKIDASGGYQPRNGKAVKFAGAPDLARYAAESDETQSAFVEKLFQYLVKQPIRAYGPQNLTNLRKSFQANDYSIRRLTVEIATTAALPGAK